jgi:hypothetical protein
MQNALKVIAWMGLVLLVLAIYTALISSWEMVIDPYSIGTKFGTAFTWILGVSGVIFMLIGGLTSKPKYFPSPSVVIGLLYIVSFFGIMNDWPDRIRGHQYWILTYETVFSILPGLTAIIEGIYLKTRTNKEKSFDLKSE